MTPGKLWRLRRLADDGGRFKMLAVDQRPPIKDLVRAARGQSEASHDDVAAVKRLLVEELAPHASAVLLDPHYSYPAALDSVSARHGLLLTLEDSVFGETPGGRISSSIDEWSVDKIARSGADAVKLLAWYRPDAAPEVNQQQKEFVTEIGEACNRFDIPFLFELLVYPLRGEDVSHMAPTELVARRTDHVIESVETFSAASFGVDVFKLESPIPADFVPDPKGDEPEVGRTAKVFEQLDQASSVPWVMLSAGAQKEAFERILTYAFAAGASGFLAGRAIWWDELASFPDIDASRQALRNKSAPYFGHIGQLADQAALPFEQHRSLVAPTWATGVEFRSGYESVLP